MNEQIEPKALAGEDPRAELEAQLGELAFYDGPEPPPKPEPTTIRVPLRLIDLANDPRFRVDPALLLAA